MIGDFPQPVTTILSMGFLKSLSIEWIRITLASMFGNLLVLFIFIPMIELFLLIQLGIRIGLMPTIGLIVLTGFLGAFLARQQGLSTLRRIQQEIGNGRQPTLELVEGMMILIGGIVLITPGIMTDLFGFALLLPGFRKALARKLKAKFAKSMINAQNANGKSAGFRKRDDDVIDI